MEGDLAGFVWDKLLEQVLTEEAFGLHRAIRTGTLQSLPVAQTAPPPPPKQPPPRPQTTKQGKGGNHHAIPIVSCPCCHAPVSGSRFAPHLEKCLNGGRRQAKATTFYEAPAERKSTRAVAMADPYPQSLVIRVKLKGQVPAPHQKRIGASIEEFNDTKRSFDKAFPKKS